MLWLCTVVSWRPLQDLQSSTLERIHSRRHEGSLKSIVNDALEKFGEFAQKSVFSLIYDMNMYEFIRQIWAVHRSSISILDH